MTSVIFLQLYGLTVTKTATYGYSRTIVRATRTVNVICGDCMCGMMEG